MKITIFLILGISFYSCSDGNIQPQEFSFENAFGVWIPYEKIYSNGALDSGPFVIGLFGAYSESFELNTDKTFTPLHWENKQEVNFSIAEMGTCRYDSNNERLFFDGAFKLEFEIVKFYKDDLWLKDSNGLHKFRRQ
jgi:hypothetical protein